MQFRPHPPTHPTHLPLPNRIRTRYLSLGGWQWRRQWLFAESPSPLNTPFDRSSITWCFYRNFPYTLRRSSPSFFFCLPFSQRSVFCYWLIFPFPPFLCSPRSQSSLPNEAVQEKEKGRATVSQFFLTAPPHIQLNAFALVLRALVLKKSFSDRWFWNRVYFMAFSGIWFSLSCIVRKFILRNFGCSGSSNWMIRWRLSIRKLLTSSSSRKLGNGRCHILIVTKFSVSSSSFSDY